MDSLYSRYASALLSIAKEENNVEDYKSKIKMWRNLFLENKELLHLFSSYFIEKQEKEMIVDQIFKDEDENIKNFVKIIIKNRRVSSIVKIFDEFIDECNEYLNILDGIVYSIKPLSTNQIESLRNNLEIRLNKKIELINLIDDRLIGGIKVVIKDQIFDGSVKNRMEKLKESLILGGK